MIGHTMLAFGFTQRCKEAMMATGIPKAENEP
jgi:hypothetical protein